MPLKKILKLSLFTFLLFSSSFLLSACGKKKESTPEPTPTPRLVELSDSQKPLISLTPRTDGHELKLIIDNIDSTIKEIEYELIYMAEDEGMIIEKGLGDNIKLEGQKKIERDLLLGTSSCTNTCKYKYDEGVTGGNLSLTLTTDQNQVAYFETPFTLTSSKNFEANDLALEDKITITASQISSGFYLLHQTFGGDQGFLLTGSGQGTAKTFSATPDTITPPDRLTGLYLAN
jgi:hypothetical protein